jgi:hypothetical protein
MVENWGYIVAAYALTGVSLLGYLWYLRQAERRMRYEQETRHVEQ